jgi:hypothetical protein
VQRTCSSDNGLLHRDAGVQEGKGGGIHGASQEGAIVGLDVHHDRDERARVHVCQDGGRDCLLYHTGQAGVADGALARLAFVEK